MKGKGLMTEESKPETDYRKKPAYRIASGIACFIFSSMAYFMLGDHFFGAICAVVAFATWEGMAQGK